MQKLAIVSDYIISLSDNLLLITINNGATELFVLDAFARPLASLIYCNVIRDRF